MRSVADMPYAMRECRWCQPPLRATPHDDEAMLDGPWECVRIAGEERSANEAECAGCAEWQPDRSFGNAG